ncbi:MAG: hypothetical protein M3Y53_02840 [Thermoproteota archaeon]|nr:hypothetical protein [Thermoproteota archaeon]
MKTRETTTIIGVLFGTMLVMSGVGLTNTILVNVTFAAAAPGNMTNATNTTNPQAVVQKGATSSNDVKTTTTNNNITLGNPFYIEYDKITSTVPGIPLNGGGHATGVTFSGNGVVKGIGFTDTGRALIIPISKTIVGIFGGLAIKANDGGGKANGNATLSFREVVHLTAAGTMQGSGAAIFNANATRDLSLLSNTVAMFTDTGNKDGTDTIKAWEWKYR